MKITRWLSALLFVLPIGCAATTEENPSDETPEPPTLGTVKQAEVLETTYDQCGSILYILPNLQSSWKKVPRGTWVTYTPWPDDDGRFIWRCGNTNELATCPNATDSISVYHSMTSREITWRCRD
jgi:hypothetical protein